MECVWQDKLEFWHFSKLLPKFSCSNGAYREVFYLHDYSPEKIKTTTEIIVMSKDDLKKLLETTLMESLEKHEAAKADSASDEAEGFMTIDEAAAFLRLKKSTIYSKISRMEIPCFKQSGRLYFKRSELEAWIEKGKATTMEDIERQADEYLEKSRKRYY